MKLKFLYEVIAKEDFTLPQPSWPVEVKKGERMDVYKGPKQSYFADVRGLYCFVPDEFFEEFYDKTKLSAHETEKGT